MRASRTSLRSRYKMAFSMAFYFAAGAVGKDIVCADNSKSDLGLQGLPLRGETDLYSFAKKASSVSRAA
jgi:hypothetical protein